MKTNRILGGVSVLAIFLVMISCGGGSTANSGGGREISTGLATTMQLLGLVWAHASPGHRQVGPQPHRPHRSGLLRQTGNLRNRGCDRERHPHPGPARTAVAIAARPWGRTARKGGPQRRTRINACARSKATTTPPNAPPPQPFHRDRRTRSRCECCVARWKGWEWEALSRSTGCRRFHPE